MTDCRTGEGKMKKFKHTRILYIWIAMLFAASFVLQVPVSRSRRRLCLPDLDAQKLD